LLRVANDAVGKYSVRSLPAHTTKSTRSPRSLQQPSWTGSFSPTIPSRQQLMEPDVARHCLLGKEDMLGHTGRSADGSIQLRYRPDNQIRNMDPGQDRLNLSLRLFHKPQPQVGLVALFLTRGY
jgi:hypothetical protein